MKAEYMVVEYYKDLQRKIVCLLESGLVDEDTKIEKVQKVIRIQLRKAEKSIKEVNNYE